MTVRAGRQPEVILGDVNSGARRSEDWGARVGSGRADAPQVGSNVVVGGENPASASAADAPVPCPSGCLGGGEAGGQNQSSGS
jgi:hypothetical protein